MKPFAKYRARREFFKNRVPGGSNVPEEMDGLARNPKAVEFVIPSDDYMPDPIGDSFIDTEQFLSRLATQASVEGDIPDSPK